MSDRTWGPGRGPTDCSELHRELRDGTQRRTGGREEVVERRQYLCRQNEQTGGGDQQQIKVQGQSLPSLQEDMEAQGLVEDRVQGDIGVFRQLEDGLLGETGLQGQQEDGVLVGIEVQQNDAVLGDTRVHGQQDLCDLQKLSGRQGQQVYEDKMTEWKEWAGVQEQLELIEEALHKDKVNDDDMQQEEAVCLHGHGVYMTQNQQEVLGVVPEPDHLQKKSTVTDSQQYAQLFTADASTEAQDLENSIEEMLIRLDEFCAMMDMIRNETSLILEEEIPAIELRVEEMNRIYCKVDKLEAFVKMVGHHVSFLEEEVIRAERNHLSFPQAVNRILAGAPIPPFRLKRSKKQSTYELPTLYRTEDYFPASCKHQQNMN